MKIILLLGALILSSIILGAVLTVQFMQPAHGAQNNERHIMCVRHTNVDVGFFDMITSNPEVIFVTDEEAQRIRFETVRKWVKDGKSRAELGKKVYNRCMGGVEA